MLNTVARPKLRDVVAGRLKSYIVEANLKPGDRLPTETDLARRFGVSRLSLREATKSLEFLGIVEARPGRGLSVGQVDMDRVTEYLGFHPALQDVPPAVLIDTRVVLEAGVLPHVVRRMERDPSLYESLDAINRRLGQAESLQAGVELDRAFHHELIAASGLTPFMAFGDLLAVFFRRFGEYLNLADAVRGHQIIIDALKAGDLVEADREVRVHIENHRNFLETTP
ncbi:FadR/GntR family transcriptional regulator [Planctomyces sp. SH-PL62]|uniref:FadR/GntR family transcriptional regulator n=1 Tax=Planctomyces sp. SH-PL62 TaxID=1636152 RepID=UPI00078EB345|nr:GntR family transcriptional regulator [Planctomyces sp. SH-PL62]AMV41040.1 Pyruvate dehydrogenase complex repressor [Planctomyces sp. SH-PL62]